MSSKDTAVESITIIAAAGTAASTAVGVTAPDGLLALASCSHHLGEEALISDKERNATVTMLSRGTLMRMSKSDFNELLNEPAVAAGTGALAGLTLYRGIQAGTTWGR